MLLWPSLALTGPPVRPQWEYPPPGISYSTGLVHIKIRFFCLKILFNVSEEFLFLKLKAYTYPKSSYNNSRICMKYCHINVQKACNVIRGSLLVKGGTKESCLFEITFKSATDGAMNLLQSDILYSSGKL